MPKHFFLLSQLCVAGVQSTQKSKTKFTNQSSSENVDELNGELNIFKSENESVKQILKKSDQMYQVFMTSIEFLIQEMNAILNTKIKCDVLAIYHERTNISETEFSKFVNNLFGLQHRQRFFQKLHLHFVGTETQLSYPLELMCSVQFLHIANDNYNNKFSAYAMIDVEHLYIGRLSQISDFANAIKKFKKLYNFNIEEQISMKDVLSFIKYLPKLEKLKIDLIRADSAGYYKDSTKILNISKLDKLRKKCTSQGTLTIYLPEDIVAATEEVINQKDIQLNLITIKPFKSYYKNRDVDCKYFQCVDSFNSEKEYFD